MYKLQVYIGGERLELFKDETVVLNSSVQNIKDISKVFTDFTQSFTIPASQVNNKILKHWYNADIENGFNSKERIQSQLELNYMPFKEGKMQLNGAKLKNGKPNSYSLTFYGNLINLSDLFGEDLLSELDLSAYDHDFTRTNVVNGLTSGLFSEAIIYPLISSERNWVWDAQGTSLQDDDIKYYTGQNNGISYRELKPGLKVNKVIEAIEDKYNISFTSNFFKDTSTHVNDIYLWLNKSKGNINPFSDEVTIFNDINYLGGVFNYFVLNVTPEVGYENVEYKIIIVNKTQNTTQEHILTGKTSSELLTDVIFITLGFGTYDIKISSTAEFKFTSYYNYSVQGISDSVGVTTITNGNTTISANLPEIKISDFFGGLVKMFNLVIEPLSATSFNVQTLDEWYDNGNVRDFSEYIDITEVNIKRPELYKTINFNYVETETILGEEFRDTNKRGYGDLESEFIYDGGNLDISVPFENVLMENLPSQLDNALSYVHVGKVIDKDLEPVEIEPYLFYKRNNVNLTEGNGFGIVDENGNASEIFYYINTGVSNAELSPLPNTGTIATQSLNFGEEVSTWDFTTETASLYSNYWQDYITDLYDNKRREYSYNAVLPLSEILKIKLNDLIIIRDRTYVINTIETNLTNGKVKLELLNYIGDVPNQYEDNFIGFNYDLNFNIH